MTLGEAKKVDGSRGETNYSERKNKRSVLSWKCGSDGKTGEEKKMKKKNEKKNSARNTRRCTEVIMKKVVVKCK